MANLQAVCSVVNKAKGVTGSSSPVGDAFDIDYVAHEMGHQFGCHHTFNGTHCSCNGNRTLSSAYEPGSGSTIMAYAGICCDQDLQAHSDAYFHARSLLQCASFITGGGHNCDNEITTGNSAPTADAGSNYNIPKQTPFILTGSGTDPDGDPIPFVGRNMIMVTRYSRRTETIPMAQISVQKTLWMIRYVTAHLWPMYCKITVQHGRFCRT